MVQDKTCLPTDQENIFQMFPNEERPSSTIYNARSRALKYLSNHCNGKHGFMGEAHTDRFNLVESSVTKIPTTFDSGLLLPYLIEEGIEMCSTDTMTNVLKNSQADSGYWRHVTIPDPWTAPFPYNLDNTSVNMMALYLTGNKTLTECQAIAKKMIENKFAGPARDVWGTQILIDQITYEFNQNESVSNLCIGAVINCLWFLATIDMDTESDVLPLMEYINTFVNKLTYNEDADRMYLPEMKFYSNVYVIFFFLSRLIEKSETAQNKFGRKFEKMLIQQSDLLANRTNPEALDMACSILAIMHLRLPNIEQCNWDNDLRDTAGIRQTLKTLCNRLLLIQDSDGSFPAWKIYQWNSIGHWGGSKCCTTGLALAAIGTVQRKVPELLM